MPRVRLEELAGYEVDVGAQMERLTPYLAAENISLSQYAAHQYEQWADLVDGQQPRRGGLRVLSILHARLKFVAEGTDPEPEAAVAYFVQELGNLILHIGIGPEDGQP